MPSDTKKQEKKLEKKVEESAKEDEATVITVKSAKKAEAEDTKEKESEPEIKFEGVPGESDVKEDTPLEGKKISSFSLLDADKSGTENDKTTNAVKDLSKESESANIEAPKESPVESKPTADTISSDEVKDWVGKEKITSDEVNLEDKPKRGVNILIFVLIIAVVAGVVAGGFYYYNTKVTKTDIVLVNKNPQPTEAVNEVTPEPTKSTEKVDYTKYSLQILNGSGIPGEAGKIKDMITTLKFKDIKTSNAANYDFKNTIVEIKKDTPTAVYDDLEELLGKTYTLELQKEYLSASSSYDVVITVGVKK